MLSLLRFLILPVLLLAGGSSYAIEVVNGTCKKNEEILCQKAAEICKYPKAQETCGAYWDDLKRCAERRQLEIDTCNKIKKLPDRTECLKKINPCTVWTDKEYNLCVQREQGYCTNKYQDCLNRATRACRVPPK